MTDHTILITAPFTEPERERLAGLGRVIYLPWTTKGVPHTEDEMVALVAEHKPAAIVVELDPITDRVLATGDVAVVGCCRAGVVNVDVDAARKRGVRVLRTPGRNAEAVAQYVVGMMIVALRNIVPAREWLLDGEWGKGERPYLKFRGEELGSKTVVLHGYGAVARRVAELLQPFGPRILAIDPYVTDPGASNVEMASTDEAYPQADILSVHLPVTEETTGAIGDALLSSLPEGALFINSARAAVVDYEALENAVNGRRLRAVLDVYRQEPLADLDHDLVRHPAVIATPHLAGATHEVVMHHSVAMTGAVTAALAGDPVEPRFVAV
ncbi:NAD(P)-dependent oxidoreductase [Microbacterium alcoholitolerans]|uniref:NAD(P)-dependent oxidoreductase n=1 Tax=unclassified Microbacterium TaxID=2609290 RepID=UPI003D172D2C